jgi:phosphoribosyl-AMP cyclohydrolase
LARWRNKAQRVFCFWRCATTGTSYLCRLPLAREDREEQPVDIDFAKGGGLIAAIVQDDRTGDVLMLGFMTQDALAETRRTQEVVFYSRSRNRLWKKGESSGHVLKVRDVRVDCDADALLVRVEPLGPGVCHEGYRSCFFRRLENDGSATVVEQRTFKPDQVYGREKKG